MIAIIDYKAGNLTSVKKAFDHIGAENVVTDDPAVIAKSDKVVLPGVGHFAATRALDNGIRAAVGESMKAGKPFLGICVGMQWMFTGSDGCSIVAPGVRRDAGMRLPGNAALLLSGSRIWIAEPLVL